MNKSKKLRKVMVLGGSGQIGEPLCDFLEKQNHKVFNVDLVVDSSHDLRKDSEIVDYWMQQVDFVYFLAYDIGGSKFLKDKQNNFNFLMNNTKIMENVFELLRKHEKPFVFASSAMTKMPWSSYGNLKKLGEHFTECLGGISARFWNVYGPERDELKSHVITDFIKKARDTGKIEMLTDGTEVRQFLYAEDCSKALYSLAQNYNKAKENIKFDVTNCVWSSIYEIAQIIADHYNAEIVRPQTKDTVQMNSRIEPNPEPIREFWNPDNAVTLKDGIAKMIDYYEKVDK